MKDAPTHPVPTVRPWPDLGGGSPWLAWIEVARVALRLGCMSFGGPVAHLGYFRAEFVVRRRWLEDAEFADLVALCQFLPGPASSQLVFAVGQRRAGLSGAIVASLLFTLPSAVLMILFAYGVAAWGDFHAAGWVHGLKLATVAVVAQAVWGLGRHLCPDRARFTLALAAAAAVLFIPGVAGEVGTIVTGAFAGWWLYRRDVGERPVVPSPTGSSSRQWAVLALAIALGLLVLLPLTASGEGRGLELFDSFYRAGALVFGGGHVVLPLLRTEVVTPGWIDDGDFLAGYGAAQALPGPMFTFAAYLGTRMADGPAGWATGLWCLLGIMLPGWLLIGGALPFWKRLRAQVGMQSAMRGTNAAVVGLLLAALYNPVWSESVGSRSDAAAVLAAFLLLETWRCPSWLIVLLMAAAGQWVL
jgi:chromate transporter